MSNSLQYYYGVLNYDMPITSIGWWRWMRIFAITKRSRIWTVNTWRESLFYTLSLIINSAKDCVLDHPYPVCQLTNHLQLNDWKTLDLIWSGLTCINNKYGYVLDESYTKNTFEIFSERIWNLNHDRIRRQYIYLQSHHTNKIWNTQYENLALLVAKL